MAAIPIQSVPEGGLANASFAAAANGDTVDTGGRRAGGWSTTAMLLLVNNTDAATKNVTVGGLAPITVPANTGRAVIPVYTEGVNDPSVLIVYSALTNLAVACVRLDA